MWGRRAPQSRHGAAWSELCRTVFKTEHGELGAAWWREGRGTAQLWAGPGPEAGPRNWGTFVPSSSGVLLDELQM